MCRIYFQMKGSVVQHFPLTVDLSTGASLRSGAEEVLAKVRPQWVQKEVEWKQYTDGITNKLMGAWTKGKKEDTVLVRVYGQGTEKIIDRKAEMDNRGGRIVNMV